MAVVAGVFEDEKAAHEALRALLKHHFDPPEISILAVERGAPHEVPIVHQTGITRGAIFGATLGSIVGAALVATGVFVGPWVVVGAGPVLAAIGGAMAGAATGTAYGAFAGMGFWKEAADLHAEALRRGAIWVGVHADGREDEAEAALREAGAVDVARSKLAIQHLLHEDHEHLHGLIAELETRSAAGTGLGAVWREFERDLVTHFAAEESHLFPPLEAAHPEAVAELRADHGRIRLRLGEIDPASKRDLDQLLQLLRDHAAREDRTVYPWADLELGDQTTQVLDRIQGLIRSRRSINELGGAG